MLVSPDPTHICECAVHTSCDSRTEIVFVSEGAETVKTATLSFKLNHRVVQGLCVPSDKATGHANCVVHLMTTGNKDS